MTDVGIHEEQVVILVRHDLHDSCRHSSSRPALEIDRRDPGT